MKILVEKREVYGVLKTNLGTYLLLGELKDTRRYRLGALADITQFHVVDSEGFENYILVSAEFTVMPYVVSEYVDVKIVLTDEEAQKLQTDQLITVDTID